MTNTHQHPPYFGTKVRDMLIERGYVTAIGNPNWRAFVRDLHTVSYESLRKAVTREREPGLKIMEEVAEALEISPDLFWEYQLAQAQRAFDPQEVGEDEAYQNLQLWLKVQSKQ